MSRSWFGSSSSSLTRFAERLLERDVFIERMITVSCKVLKYDYVIASMTKKERPRFPMNAMDLESTASKLLQSSILISQGAEAVSTS